MTYELARKLKDAGFPQVFKDGSWFNEPNKTAYNPTFSELITACGDGFQELSKQYRQINGEIKFTGWSARSEAGDEAMNYEEGNGETPEIAVANLWLKLNGK